MDCGSRILPSFLCPRYLTEHEQYGYCQGLDPIFTIFSRLQLSVEEAVEMLENEEIDPLLVFIASVAFSSFITRL